jgi:hypothetical protein
MKSATNNVIEMIDKLPDEERVFVFKYLKENVEQKMGSLLTKIRKRNEIYPITIDEITNEVEAVREKQYECTKNKGSN